MPEPRLDAKSALRRFAPRTVRAHRILGGQLRGRIIVTSIHDYPAAILGRTEQPLLGWFREKVRPGETWLDVGAHYGYTAIALADLVGDTGHVYAFEPSLTTAGYLNQTCVLNGFAQMKILPLGLGEPGELRPLSVSIDRGMANHALGGSTTETIYVIGFDHLWRTIGGGPIHGVKIDVQGMELQVLRGMFSALVTYRPRLVIEFHAGVHRDAIAALLRSASYRLPGQAIDLPRGDANVLYRDDRSYSFEPAPKGS